jgi:hypothetical protein
VPRLASAGNSRNSPRGCLWLSAAGAAPCGAADADLLLAGVLGLRWFRDRTAPDALARDHGISRATTYRYLDEVIAVLAD